MLTVRDTRLFQLTPVGLALFVLTLAGCGGGGPGPGTGPTATPTPVQTAPPFSQSVQGTVLQIPVDAYGPVTMTTTTGATATYASADATTTAPLANATVVIGPVPIVGATPPASLPSGDVSVTTNSSGSFSATLSVAPSASTNAEPFVIPLNNFTSFVPPATGYYVQVFGVGTDGKSAGLPLPLHRFISFSSAPVLHVSTASAAEASALVAVNADRLSNAGAGPLTFDESAEESARLHASDQMLCHYNALNIGPSSRYLNAGGIGLTGENIGTGSSTVGGAFQSVENQTLAEKALIPPGAHYNNLVDSAHVWTGLSAVPLSNTPTIFIVDYEFVTPNGQDSVVASFGYTNLGCTAFAINNS